MKIYMCDRCKEMIKIEEDVRTILKIQLSNKKSGVFDERHLCKECEEEFYNFMDGKEDGDDNE